MAQRRKAGSEELEAKQAYWDRRIAQWRDSGLSQRVFCESQGLALSTFQWWRKRLAESPSAQPRFLPIELKPAAAATVGATVQIELASGTRLRLEGEAALRAVDALVRRVS
jgi:hypothetical protein